VKLLAMVTLIALAGFAAMRSGKESKISTTTPMMTTTWESNTNRSYSALSRRSAVISSIQESERFHASSRRLLIAILLMYIGIVAWNLMRLKVKS
jgi:hypothetical protein